MKFSNRALRRLRTVTRAFFETPQNEGSHRAVYQGRPTQAVWFQLTANLTVGGTANANKVNFAASGDSGNGSYSVDTGTSYTLKDLQSQHWGVAGERVLAKPIYGANGVVWEVLSSGAAFHVFSLSADMAQGATVNGTVTIAGSSRTVSLTEAVLPSGYTFTSGTSVFAWFDVQANAWKVTGKQFEELSPMTNFNVDTSTYKLQRKDTDAAVLIKKTEDASWTDIHTGTACT